MCLGSFRGRNPTSQPLSRRVFNQCISHLLLFSIINLFTKALPSVFVVNIFFCMTEPFCCPYLLLPFSPLLKPCFLLTKFVATQVCEEDNWGCQHIRRHSEAAEVLLLGEPPLLIHCPLRAAMADCLLVHLWTSAIFGPPPPHVAIGWLLAEPSNP